MYKSLNSLIQDAQSGNKESMSYLLEKFSPLIRKMSYQIALKGKTDQEDVYSDLQLEFILLIHNIKLNCIENVNDGALVNYIAKSIKRAKPMSLSNIKETVGFGDLSPAEARETQLRTSNFDTYDRLLLLDLEKLLTPKEFIVIKWIFFDGQTVKEIAMKAGITRQSVNQIKLRALKKLKKRI